MGGRGSSSGIKRGGKSNGRSASATSSKPVTVGAFKSALDDLHKTREFPRICDLRERLGWEREEFDGMLRELRDSMTIHMTQADRSLLTDKEYKDSFTDENGYVMGLISWNVDRW